MTKKEMIELYSTILRQWNETIEDQRKKCEGSADETMYVDATFVTNMLKDFIKSLANMEDEKAIEFLKHLGAWCDNHNYCLDCPYEDTDGEGIVHCKIDGITGKSDAELADLVRKVERWWRENDR